MKSQKLLFAIVFLFFNISIFSQDGNEENEKEITEKSDKIDYEKLKETFLAAIKEAEKEKEEIVGTFTIKRGFIEIEEANQKENSEKNLGIQSQILNNIKTNGLISISDSIKLFKELNKDTINSLKSAIKKNINIIKANSISQRKKIAF